MNCSPPSFFVHGILQARILEWAAMPFSKVQLNVWLVCARNHAIYSMVSSTISFEFITTVIEDTLLSVFTLEEIETQKG